MYYLQSRYYDPEVCRFINADEYTSTGQDFLGYNMFTYCNNCPATNRDTQGKSFTLTMAVVVGGMLGLIALTGIMTAPGFQEACRDAVKAVVDTIKEVDTQPYTVYLLKDSSGDIKYVGRVKTKYFDARMNHHKHTRGLNLAYRIDGLDYATARGLEEELMMELHLLNKDNPQNNQIHGVGPNNANGEKYLQAGLDYLSNKAESILLDMLPG